MKKEKTVRTYKRRTKSGKVVVVRQHTAKYDAAERAKELAKKEGSGEELKAKKKKRNVDLSIIQDLSSPWLEFENNFEEGWGGDKNVRCLANHAHHLEVAAEAARELSKKFDNENEVYRRHPGEKGTKFIQRYYDAAAKKLYPKEKLWSGDNVDNPAFWREHLKGASSRTIKALWNEEWGPFDSTGKFKKSKKVVSELGLNKSAKKTSKSTTSEPSFTADDYKAWYHWDQDADPKNKAALKVEKALKKQMGTKAYNKYFDEMSDNYSPRGHKKAHEALLAEHTERQKKQDAEISKAAKDIARGAKEAKTTKGGASAKAEVAKVKAMKSKVEAYVEKHGLTYEEDGVYSNRKGENFVLGMKDGKVVKKKVNDHLTADSEAKASKKSKDSKGSELSGEKVGSGIAFKDNKAGQAWAKKNGEPVAPFGKEGRTYYKVGNDLYGNITGGHGGTIWGKVGTSTAKRLLKYSELLKAGKN